MTEHTQGSLMPESEEESYLFEQTPAPRASSTAAYNSFMSFAGDKFAGGFGDTNDGPLDYIELRSRSTQLFNENPYAAGIISRLITSEINTGLTPELTPDEDITGLDEEGVNLWSEATEKRFGLWGKATRFCDWGKAKTFGAIQRACRLEALLAGDCLVVMDYSRITRLPSIRLVSACKVKNPFDKDIPKGHTVVYGVESDSRGRVVAYWVQQDDGDSKRMPAYGPRSGRRIAWLVFGSEARIDEKRGVPLLTRILQSLRDIDRYKDSTQRKAVNNSMWAMSVKKTQPVLGTRPITGGATRIETQTFTDGDNSTRDVTLATGLPGMTANELAFGEELVMHGGQGTDEEFGSFEEAIVKGIAWTLEIPPEILTLSFSSNYSASQAAINEFKIYLEKVWSHFGEDFCTPIYVEWLISETLLGNITAPGLLAAWRDRTDYANFQGWVDSKWYGSTKPSTDMLKMAKAAEKMLQLGLTTRERESRGANGTSFISNAKKLKRENEMLAEALRPMLEMEAEFGADNIVEARDDFELRLIDKLEDTVS